MVMHVNEDDPEVFRRRVMMLCLIGAHLLFGLALGAVVRLGDHSNLPSVPLAFFVGLVFAQASLLGVWSGLAAGPWWLRLIVLGVGSGCLGIGVGIAIGEADWETFFIFAFTSVTVTAVLTVFRCIRFRIGLPTSECNDRTELQFSIRHLLILTVVVAVMLAVGRNLKFSLSDIGEVPFLVILASAYALVGVLSPWAILGGRLVVVRGMFLLAVATGAGWGVGQMVSFAVVYWIGMALTEGVLLVASLLVVRSCGYRLMRRRPVLAGKKPSKIA